MEMMILLHVTRPSLGSFLIFVVDGEEMQFRVGLKTTLGIYAMAPRRSFDGSKSKRGRFKNPMIVPCREATLRIELDRAGERLPVLCPSK